GIRGSTQRLRLRHGESQELRTADPRREASYDARKDDRFDNKGREQASRSGGKRGLHHDRRLRLHGFRGGAREKKEGLRPALPGGRETLLACQEGCELHALPPL